MTFSCFKAENIVVIKKMKLDVNCIKVIDFGMSKILKSVDEVPFSHSPIGTADFCPPEKVSSRLFDSYSIGITLLQMVLQCRPSFDEDTGEEELMEFIQQMPVDLGGVVSDLVNKKIYRKSCQEIVDHPALNPQDLKIESSFSCPCQRISLFDLKKVSCRTCKVSYHLCCSDAPKNQVDMHTWDCADCRFRKITLNA
jgi:serine/threonine protein kinase